MPTKINVVVNLQVEGIHYWPECPLEDVSFLKDKHRHIFHVTAKKEVQHTDRDVEIIELKRDIRSYLLNKYALKSDVCEFGRMSCEDIATELCNQFNLNYCQVLEDNENGAEIIITE